MTNLQRVSMCLLGITLSVIGICSMQYGYSAEWLKQYFIFSVAFAFYGMMAILTGGGLFALPIIECLNEKT